MKRLSLFLILTLLSSLTPGCTRHSQNSSNSALRFQLSNEPVSLDPMLAEDGVALQVLYNTSEGLVAYDGKGLLQNRMAETYTVSRDGKRYEFVLRKDAKWSDGRPVQASDFVAGLRRSLSPKLASKLSSLLYPIQGARAYHDGRLPAEKLGVREENGKLVIQLDFAAPYFIQALTLPATLPIREDVLRWKLARSRSIQWSLSYRVASIGPKIVLEANPYYYWCST